MNPATSLKRTPPEISIKVADLSLDEISVMRQRVASEIDELAALRHGMGVPVELVDELVLLLEAERKKNA